MADKEITLRNCQFAFRCSRSWDSLQPSASEWVRFCEDCEKHVHLCRTDHELLKAIQEDKCVAIILKKADELDPSSNREFFGVGTMARTPYLGVIQGGKDKDK